MQDVYASLAKLDLTIYHIRQAGLALYQALEGNDGGMRNRFEDILYELDQEREYFLSVIKNGE